MDNKIKNENITVRELIEFFIDIDTNNYEKDFEYSYSIADNGYKRDVSAKKFADRIETLVKLDQRYHLIILDHLFTREELGTYAVTDDDAVINCLMTNTMYKSTEYQRLLFNNKCKNLILKPYVCGSRGKKILNQKWHLLISIYAYLEVINNIAPYNEYFSKNITTTFKGKNFFDLNASICYEEVGSQNYCLIYRGENEFLKLNYKSLDLITWMLEAACVKRKYDKTEIKEILVGANNNSKKMKKILSIIRGENSINR